MPNQADSIDITLLQNNKDEFILRCQRIIHIIVKKFIQSGMFNHSQFSDVVQSVNVELIKRLHSIEQHYNGSVLLNTYMNVVIRNICLRIHKQERFTVITEPLSEDLISNESSYVNAIYIQDELRLFHLTLQLFHSMQQKMMLCFRIYFRITVPVRVLAEYFTGVSSHDLRTLQGRFGKQYDETLEIDNFNDLAPYMNKQERNATSGESLRRWTLEYLTRVITIMNGTPPVKSHTKDTIKILFEQLTQEY